MPDSPEEIIDPAATDVQGDNAREGARKRRDPNEPAAVVGIGASAGGVSALQHFFGETPVDSRLAFVVVMHLAPDHESNLAAVLQQRTSMPVIQVSESVKVKPNHIYVIPPGKQLTFEDSTLNLVAPQQAIGRRITIDLFFRTLAQSWGQRSVCIVLSGADSDGVIGLKHIRAQGGVTLAQDPSEAEYETMPLSAINTGMVDHVLPVAAMPQRLMEFVQNEDRMQLPPEIPEAEEADAKVEDAPGGETVSDVTRDTEDESALAEVLAHVRAQTGHDFAHYKRATVLRRIARRLQVNSIDSIPSYLNFLRKHPAESRGLLQDLLIGVTHFFRDRESFAALEANIPQLFAGKRKGSQIRVWVAGCASGEEAYSIAMLLCEHAERLDDPPLIQVFATDIDEQAIVEARDGSYPATIEADVSPERLREFFVKDGGHYRVRKELRDKVLFAAHNLLRDAPFSRLDLVSCRNLLIYLNAKAQGQVFDIFHFSLRSGGLLFIGSSEAGTSVNSLFSAVDAKHRVYVRRSMPRPAWRLPMLPMRAPAPAAQVTRKPRNRALPALTRTDAEEATTDTAESIVAGQERRAILFGELHLKLLEQYGPPSVVVNETHDIVHLSEKAGRYLHFVAGEPTANIMAVVNPALQIELRTALFRAAQTNESVTASPRTIEVDGTNEVVVLTVRPMRGSTPAQGYFLVVFERPSQVVPAALPQAGDVDRELENEIQLLKQELSSTVEQYDAANEELKASNEELQAMNEEMRSATEELETSKEELQSVNEELTTVNNELKDSVEELSRTNSDLHNLMASTDIATIFLDRQLRIQRFTPSAQAIFNLIPADMGRPLSDITHKLAYDGLIADGEKVLGDLTPIEREVRLVENRWFLLRIAPYRTAEDRIAGVVATFIDITRRRHAEEELRASEERMRGAFEVETVGVIFFRIGGSITDANEAFLRMSGYTREDVTSGALRLETVTPPEWISLSREAMQELKETGHSTPREKEYLRKDGSRWWGVFTSARLDGEENVKYVLDVTPQKQAERALSDSEERFRLFAENSADVFWIIDAETKQIDYLNPVYEKMWGESRQERGTGIDHWLNTILPEDRERAATILPTVLKGETCVVEYRIKRPSDDSLRWIRDTGFPIPDASGGIARAAGVAQDVTEDRKRMEETQRAEQRFQLLVEGTPDYAMFLMNPDNVISYWSSGAEKVFGWSAEEAVGKTGELIFTPEDRAKGAVEKELGMAREKGFAPDRRWHLRKDSSRLWVDGVMRRIDRDDGSIRGYAKIARDATDQRAIEDQLRYARDEMEQRVVDRTEELVAMNTELQNAMNARQQLERELLDISEREKRRIGQDLHDIVCQELTAAALYLKSSANKEEKKDPAVAKRLSDAADIVNRNVTLARNLARGFQPVQLSAGQFTAALRALVAQMNTTRGIRCRAEMPRTLHMPDEIVALNLYRIAQEALSNAIKHSGGDEVILSLKREHNDVRLIIEDNGCGFRPRKRSKGLGLHIMKYRASVLGGSLTVDSKPKKGTRITAVVPIKSSPRETQ